MLVGTGADLDGETQDAATLATGGAALPLVRKAYPRLAKDLLRPLLAVLASARGVCAGDAQKSEILMLIAMRSVEHPDFLKLSYETIVSGAAASYGSLGTNIRSIADSSGIPRETVRRKVSELTAAGLVERNGNSLSLSPKASRVIGPLREAVLRLAVANFELIAGLTRPPANERQDSPADEPGA